MITASMSARVCSVPLMSFSAPTLNFLPGGSEILSVLRPVDLAALDADFGDAHAAVDVNAVLDQILLLARVSGISPTFSSAIISTDLAPASFAATAQSSAVAPPPITATFLPLSLYPLGFCRKLIPPMAFSLFGMCRMIGFPQARRDDDRLVALLQQRLGIGDFLSRFQLDEAAAQTEAEPDVFVEHFLVQAVLGNEPAHAAGLFVLLVDVDLVSLLGQRRRGAKAGRARANHGHGLAVGLRLRKTGEITPARGPWR